MRIRMFNKLDSKMCMVTVLGYLLTWEQAEKFFRCLNRQGQAYYDTHKAQFRHFINDAPVPRMAVNFGNRSFQVIKPKRFARIDFLEFGFITSDLYTIESFAKDTMEIGRLHVGNRGFTLFQDANLDEMVGLELPFAIKCRESDRGNLRTIVALLKKSRVLSLDRIKTTWPILHLLNLQWQHFPNLKGLRLEFMEDVYEHFM